MRNWTADELDTIGATAELGVAPVRPDGSLRRATPVWVVRVGDDLCAVLSGCGGSWFRHPLHRREGRIRAGEGERDVTLEEPNDVYDRAIDETYHTKYARYGGGYVEAMVSPNARAATLRLVARLSTRGDGSGRQQRTFRCRANVWWLRTCARVLYR